jgi:hypothetical protein
VGSAAAARKRYLTTVNLFLASVGSQLNALGQLENDETEENGNGGEAAA